MINKRVQAILEKIKGAVVQSKWKKDVRLLAVSKTKTVEEIKAAYDCGIRHFGENYVDEIEEKQPKVIYFLFSYLLI